MSIAKVEIVNQPVVRLTVDLPQTAAAELAELLGHMSFADFPWAQSIYRALERADIRGTDVLTDWAHGPDIFIVRKDA